MSAPTKLRAGNSELTKLKGLWRDSLSESAQEFWRSLFISDTPQKQIREQLLAKLKVRLHRDDQLTAFRQWLDEQDARDLEAQRQLEDEQQLKQEFGAAWTLEQIRTEVLKRSYARALSTGDFASGRKTIVQDLNVQKVALDARRVAILEKKAAAFDAAKEIVQSTLTPEQQRARLKEILK